MNSRPRIQLPWVLLLAPASCWGLLVASCSDAHAGAGGATPAVAATPHESAAVAPIADQPLSGHQKELLELAFDTASSFPKMPHIKTRSRVQEAVVEACFALDQPQRALEYTQKIENWMRGVGYAEYASYCAKHGDAARAQQYMDLAREVYEKTEKDAIQDWQRDQIRVTIARTLAFLGRGEEAVRFMANVEDSQAGKAQATQETLAGADLWDESERVADEALKTGNFDLMRNALEKCARYFNRKYEEPDRRSLAEAKIRASWEKLPILVRVELMIELAGYALDHADNAKALDLVQDTVAMMEASTWAPEDRIPKMAQLACIRHRAGDDPKARSDAEAALAMFEAERGKIPDIHRADALRPLAETYLAIGDATAAQRVYAKAVEAGVVNINSRPRAEDLSATCCSMALHGFEPDAKLLARLQEIRTGLGDPW